MYFTIYNKLIINHYLSLPINVNFALECKCDPDGSVNRSNVCEPDENGQCPCKLNVHGVRCDTCNDTYYGLTHEDVNGCKGKDDATLLCNCIWHLYNMVKTPSRFYQTEFYLSMV